MPQCDPLTVGQLLVVGGGEANGEGARDDILPVTTQARGGAEGGHARGQDTAHRRTCRGITPASPQRERSVSARCSRRDSIFSSHYRAPAAPRRRGGAGPPELTTSAPGMPAKARVGAGQGAISTSRTLLAPGTWGARRAAPRAPGAEARDGGLHDWARRSVPNASFCLGTFGELWPRGWCAGLSRFCQYCPPGAHGGAQPRPRM